jgi:hypothetical protein
LRRSPRRKPKSTFPTATTEQAVPRVPAATGTVSRTTKAVHYRLEGGTAALDFEGSDLLKSASGEAKVEGKKTNFSIEAKFQNLEDATKFGLEF